MRTPGALATGPLVALTVAVVGVLACDTPDAHAQAPPDSIAAWTERLRSGTLAERVSAASKLSVQDPTALPGETRDAIVAELRRINDALLYDRPIPGRDALAGEDLGAHHLNLTTTAAAFDSPEADRALVLSVGVSLGVERRAAQLGDEAVPILVEMIERDYSAGAAVSALALAWFWADSTGAPLSAASRRTILRQIIAATQGDDSSHRVGAVSALQYVGDPMFLPFARAFRDRARELRPTYLANAIGRYAIPALEAATAEASTGTLAERASRMLDLICADAAPGPKRGACRSLENQLDAALRHLRAGRRVPARNGFAALARRADQARDAGALSDAEHALVAGGARMIVERLEM